MTEVAFHFNAPEPVAYVCRLLRKAVASGAKLVVIGSPPVLEQLDRALWTFSPTDFVPHCFLDSESYVVAASPVILSVTTLALPHQQVLINLGQAVPDGFERFERVIEVVGLKDDERQSARSRWKQYADQGYAITRHDLTLKASN